MRGLFITGQRGVEDGCPLESRSSSESSWSLGCLVSPKDVSGTEGGVQELCVQGHSSQGL